MSTDKSIEGAKSGANSDHGREPLINRVMSEAGTAGTAQIASNENFRPFSTDIQNLLDTERLYFGLNRTNLSELTAAAVSSGDLRKEQLLKHLGKHFDDVVSLSNDGQRISITKDDLTLYADLLKRRESAANGTNLNPRELEDAHSRHHMRGFPTSEIAGTVLGVVAANRTMTFVGSLEPVNQGLIKHFNSTRSMALIGGTYVAGLVSGGYLGHKAGSYFSQGLNSANIRTHFHDEAAPAMRRLLKGY